MTFENLLSELAEKLGFQAPEAGESQITLDIDGKWHATAERDGETGEILVFMPVPLVVQGGESLPKKLEERALFGAGTAGFALSWSRQLDSFVLWRRYRDDFSGADEVAAILSRLVDVASSLSNEDGFNQESEPVASDAGFGNLMGFLNA